jgi:hypothetical protein
MIIGAATEVQRNSGHPPLRLAGHPNLAAALRHTGRDPTRPLAILGLAYR